MCVCVNRIPSIANRPRLRSSTPRLRALTRAIPKKKLPLVRIQHIIIIIVKIYYKIYINSSKMYIIIILISILCIV